MRRQIMLLLLFALYAPMLTAAPNLQQPKFSPALRLLLALRQNPIEELPQNVQSIVSAPELKVTVRFAQQIDPVDWINRGLRLRQSNGRFSGSGSIYGADVSWDEINRWVAEPEVLMISSDWNPKIVPCLDLSASEVGATNVWDITGPAGFPIVGEDQMIADFDTGIDVFHPGFFRLTEIRYDWIDIDQNNEFTPGVDAVDLDSNGTGTWEEILEFIDAWIYDEAGTFGGSQGVSNDDGVYQVDWDWLYNDENGDGERNYGSEFGYTDDDPCFGELLFHCDDLNGNNQLDPGEQLILLGESKIQAVMDFGTNVRTRGIDLIQAVPDYNGHGTAVCGILAGGEPGISRLCGLAPEADLLVGYSFNYVSFADYLPWVRDMGCNILLYEFCGWIFNPLDGSTNEELLLDYEAGMGVMQVAPSGNLNRGYKHCQLNLNSGEDLPIQLDVNIYNGVMPTVLMATFLWREPSVELSFSLEDPYGSSIDLDGDSLVQYISTWGIYSDFWVSPRETAEYDLFVYGTNNEPVIGTWTLTVHHPGGPGFELNGNLADDASSWEGGAEWIDYRSNDKTVTWPATADSAFVLGSYSTRGYEQYLGVGSGSIQTGEISLFSGRGARIDGISILSLAAPGNYDVYTARSIYGFPYTHGGYRQFSGTSAAGPHVAAAAALVWQADPDLARIEVEQLLEQYAIEDEWTGATYNDTWGHGKIRIEELINYLEVPLDESSAALPTQLTLTAFPNPFNATVSLRAEMPFKQDVKIVLFDLLGREVATIYQGNVNPGIKRFTYDASELASGVYVYQLTAGEHTATGKMVLMK